MAVDKFFYSQKIKSMRRKDVKLLFSFSLKIKSEKIKNTKIFGNLKNFFNDF